MYWSSASDTNEEWMDARPTPAAAGPGPCPSGRGRGPSTREPCDDVDPMPDYENVISV